MSLITLGPASQVKSVPASQIKLGTASQIKYGRVSKIKSEQEIQTKGPMPTTGYTADKWLGNGQTLDAALYRYLFAAIVTPKGTLDRDLEWDM